MKGCCLKEELRSIWKQPSKEEAEKVPDTWLKMANGSGVEKLQDFATTLRDHRVGIMNYYDCRISTGPLEGTNKVITEARLWIPRPRILDAENICPA
jgi:transposase